VFDRIFKIETSLKQWGLIDSNSIPTAGKSMLSCYLKLHVESLIKCDQLEVLLSASAKPDFNGVILRVDVA